MSKNPTQPKCVKGRSKLDDRTTGAPVPCEVCEFPIGEAHRLKPGSWGGTYAPENVVFLCPNHHRGVHHLIAWYMNPFLGRRPKGVSLERFSAETEVWYGDGALRQFFLWRVKPILIARLQFLGLWHPYQKGYVAPPGSSPRFSH